MMHLTTDLFNKIQDMIYNQSSLRFSPARLTGLESKIRERIVARGLTSYDDYYQVLLEDLHEFDVLIEGITTKETYFFRLPGQFEALARVILPRIEEKLSLETRGRIAANGGVGFYKPPLRFWSAGCATGEEVYSLMMTALSHLAYPRAWDLEVLATDISKEALTTASLGYYDKAAQVKIPGPYQEKYLNRLSQGVVINEDLVKRISFRVFNLRGLDPGQEACAFTRLDRGREVINLAGRFHVIFCRNVMIYFDFAAQQRLVDNLYNCLQPGGCLFTGDAELLHIYRHRFETLEFEGTYYYRKPF